MEYAVIVNQDISHYHEDEVIMGDVLQKSNSFTFQS